MALVHEILGFGPQPADATTRDVVLGYVHDLFGRAIPPDVTDDRLGKRWANDIVTDRSYRIAVALDESGSPMALVERWTTDSGISRVEVLIDPSLTLHQVSSGGGQLLEQLLHKTRTRADDNVATIARSELWARPDTPASTDLANRISAQPSRELHQMQAPASQLALSGPDTSTGYTDADLSDVIRLNNLAFADHPDQAGMTPERFHAEASQPWFTPAGLRLWRHDGQLVAFCWTKIHTVPPVGEIYVVAVAPDAQGQGFGRLVTSAGIAWMAAQGNDRIMLYVEADNTAAVTVYSRLGFTTVRTDKAWTFDEAKETI